MIKLLDKAALISIARYCDHPVAFLVGAPLSGDAGGGVPGVAPMLELVREEISKRAAPELPRYDAKIATCKPGGDAYQAAMEWLQGNVGQPAVNRVIEVAVLKARKAGAAPNFAKNGKDCDWYIPPGTQQLAQLVCRDLSQPKPHFPGPILTTNFDPLLSLAIETCKARAHWRVVQSDGKLADVGENEAVEVIHLHGFWRGSDTLHTSTQLNSPRPALRDSLRKILKQKTLIVAAYGGWDDVFARALLGANIAEVLCAIVRQTVRTSQDVRIGETFTRIIHAGPRLERELPRQFIEQRRKEIAVATANSAVLHQSTWLGCVVDLGKTYRNAGDFAVAIQVFRDNLPTAPNKVDFSDVIRGYWNEWGVAEGASGDERANALANPWLVGLSLADHLKPVPITSEQAKLSCASLGVAFGKLAEPRPDCPFARARRASAYLGRLSTSDPKALGYFNKHDRSADRIHTPHPKSIEEAIGWLTTAVAQAGSELQDPFLKVLLKPEQVSFNMLRDFLNPAPAPRPRAKAAYVPPPAPKAPRVDDTKPVQWRSPLEEKIKTGIERVLREAWDKVPEDTALEDRFKVARRKADDSINGLSPHIKRQVRAHFNAENWESLRTSDPKH